MLYGILETTLNGVLGSLNLRKSIFKIVKSGHCLNFCFRYKAKSESFSIAN